MQRKSPDVCLYHGITNYLPCPDGIAAAWVVNRAFINSNIKFITCIYEAELPDIDDYQNILVVDFSFPLETLETWRKKGKQITIIDHHKSFYQSVKATNRKIGVSYYFNNDKCAATLCWDLFFPEEPMPVFLSYIQDRDLFTKVLENTDIVHCGMGKLGRTFRLFDELYPLGQIELIWRLYPYGEPIVQKRKIKIDKYLTKAILIDQFVPCVSMNKSDIYLKSDVAEQLGLLYSDCPFVVVRDKSEPTKIRLRSNKSLWNIDLTDYFDVSGHSTACNFNWEGTEIELSTFLVQKATEIKQLKIQ